MSKNKKMYIPLQDKKLMINLNKNVE